MTSIPPIFTPVIGFPEMIQPRIIVSTVPTMRQVMVFATCLLTEGFLRISRSKIINRIYREVNRTLCHYQKKQNYSEKPLASCEACSRNSRIATVSQSTAFRIGPMHQIPFTIAPFASRIFPSGVQEIPRPSSSATTFP